MLTETTVSTILTASIAGAGLIMAIYALITPLSRQIFKEKVRLLREKKKQFDKMKEEINSESSDKEFKRFKELASQIKAIRLFPRYLSVGVLLVFMGYMLTTFFALVWLVAIVKDAVTETVLALSFYLSTFGFLSVGIITIFDVYGAMKGEFEHLKKEKKEVEKAGRVIMQKYISADAIIKAGEEMKRKSKKNQQQ